MGDANAKVGRDNVERGDVMGLGDINENEDLFIDFCAQNELVIDGTLFKHKNTVFIITPGLHLMATLQTKSTIWL